MHKQEFIDRVTGLPWANRACTFDSLDCWGLVVLYYRHVLGVELHHSPDYESGNEFRTCFDGEVVYWSKTDIFHEDGIFIAWYGQQPVHVGLIVNGMAFHSRCEGGHVRADPVRTIQRLYTKVEFYSYANNRNSASAGITEGEGSCTGRGGVLRVA
ncbi:NlpC/P60 family protein [Scandinavium goeteborgense]|uniref:NlpC/P60 family protein n=1 Tax=Scandinavium goeteborgense TaxID=1851514 RepID=UPI00105E647F|nr:NlpC/P60 family protein [Scandinavium goeteborgense]